MSDQPNDDTQPLPQPPGPPAPSWGSAHPPAGGPPAQAPQGWAPTAPRHSGATTALVLGILGLALCQLLAPIAWYLGAQAVKEIDASHGNLSGRSEANAGKIMGIIGTVLIVLVALFFLVVVVGVFSLATV